MVKDACSPFNIATDWKQFAKAHKERAVLSPFQPTNRSGSGVYKYNMQHSALCFGCEQYQNAQSKKQKRKRARHIQHDALLRFYVYAVAPHNGAHTHTHVSMALVCPSKLKSVFSFFMVFFKFKHSGGHAFRIFARQLDVRRTKEISVASCFLN
jgi:hypothetical protein